MNSDICFTSDHCITIAPDTMCVCMLCGVVLFFTFPHSFRPSVNDLFDIVLIALFESAVFPLVTRMNGGHVLKPLPKIAVGMFCAVLSFIAAGFVQVGSRFICFCVIHSQTCIDCNG